MGCATNQSTEKMDAVSAAKKVGQLVLLPPLPGRDSKRDGVDEAAAVARRYTSLAVPCL